VKAHDSAAPTDEPTPAFTIRLLSADDLQSTLEVYRGCEDFLALGPVATASAEMVQQDMRLSAEIGGSFCGIFAPSGDMIGVLDYVSAGFEGDARQAFLELLMIAAPYRSQGYGAAVVAWLEAELRRNPRVDTILAGVQVNNPAAIRFWQRMGFAIVSAAEQQNDGTTAFRLRKSLP
jgi:ribosomal protein S18 acetylase RimI-like enzyme